MWPDWVSNLRPPAFESDVLSGSADKFIMLFFLLINVKCPQLLAFYGNYFNIYEQNCWHFNIYEQEKFQAQLS